MDELLDLKYDPYEINNLINKIKNKELLIEMKDRLAKWRVNSNDLMNKKLLRNILAKKNI
jgi:hypothetical protein